MKFFETSKYYTLKKSTYISLRWIGIIGQLISIYTVYFYFNFDFDFIASNIVIFIGILFIPTRLYIHMGRTISCQSSLPHYMNSIPFCAVPLYPVLPTTGAHDAHLHSNPPYYIMIHITRRYFIDGIRLYHTLLIHATISFYYIPVPPRYTTPQ